MRVRVCVWLVARLRFGPPEHVSGTEDHVELRAVQLCSSLRHLRRFGQTGLFQQELAWRERGEDRGVTFVFGGGRVKF